jgi:hypothetical protein
MRSVLQITFTLLERDQNKNSKLRWIRGVFTAVTKKCMVFWVITPYISETARSFGGKCHFHLQPRKHSCFCWFLVWITLRTWRWRRRVPPRRWSLAELRGVTARNTVLFLLDVGLSPNYAVLHPRTPYCSSQTSVSRRIKRCYRPEHRTVLPRRRSLTELRGVTSQNTVPFLPDVGLSPNYAVLPPRTPYCSSQTSVSHRTTRCYHPEERTLQELHRCALSSLYGIGNLWTLKK